MATSTVTMQPPNPPAPTAKQQQYRQLVHYTSLGALIVCPLLIALPPRKLDFYTIGLFGVTGIGANQVAREYTGYSLVERAQMRASSLASAGQELPSERAREVQIQLKREREAQQQRSLLGGPGGLRTDVVQAAGNKENLGADGKVLAALAEHGEGKGGVQQGAVGKERGALEKLWMGSETDDWKARRDAKEKEALLEGKGYGDLIMEQIWEVWNWGRDKTEEIREKDVEVVKKEEEGKR